VLVLYIFRGYTGINAKDSDDGREALLWSWRSIKVLSCICSGILCDFEIAATFSKWGMGSVESGTSTRCTYFFAGGGKAV